MARIVIYTGYSAEPWNARSLSHADLAGTETAVCYTAAELAAIGHSVYVIGDKIIDEVIDGVFFQSTNQFKQKNIHIYDVVISVAYLHVFELFNTFKHTVFEWIFWQHNTEPYYWYNGQTMSDSGIQSAYEKFDQIWVPSDWTTWFIPKEYQHKTRVLMNGINSIETVKWDTDKFSNLGTKPFKLIWSSCLSRGIEIVLNTLPIIRSLIPTAELHVFHPSYSLRVAPESLLNRVKSLADDPSSGVIYHGPKTKAILYQHMASSHVWTYPTAYEETFCMTALEMIAHGVVPCISDVANLYSFKDMCGRYGPIDIKKDIKSQLVNSVLAAYSQTDTSTLVQNAEYIKERYDWKKVGEQANKLIQNNYVMKPSKLIDTIYVITSDYEAAANQLIPREMLKRIRKLGISDVLVKLIPAVNGKDLTEQMLDEHGLQLYNWQLPESNNSWWNRPLTLGEIGCTLSHLVCWHDAAASGVKKGILVLEDDFLAKSQYHDNINEDTVPSDYHLLYLGRNAILPDKPFNHPQLVKPGYSYNTHAYMLSAKGIQNFLDHDFRNKIIPADEMLSATFDHPREDLNFIWKDTNAYSVKNPNNFVVQSNNESTTQNGLSNPSDPELVRKTLKVLLNKPVLLQPQEPVVQPVEAPIIETQVVEAVIETPQNITLYDYFIHKDAWLKKYICSAVINKEWELIIDHPIPGVACFNMFKPVFCEELIQLAEESDKWTTSRHDFYPTTDFIINEIGLKSVYDSLIREYIAPAMKWFYGLEGEKWRNIVSEDFVAKYTPDSQAHLSLHHDYSNVTALVNLSHKSTYTGGGTYFQLYKQTHIGEQGQVTLHPGEVSHRHGGRPVLTGSRYILVSFIRHT